MSLEIGNIEITSIPDHDNEIELTMTDKIDNSHYQYLTEDDAIKIVKHLQEVFDMPNNT